MSKSLGNTVDPMTIIEGGNNKKKEPPYGADVLRLWVSSVDYSSDVPLGQNILKQQADIYRKIRNTAKYLLGSLHDFDPAKHTVPYEELAGIDKYILHRMSEVFAEVTDAYENYQFFRFFQTIQNFCVVDLSNFYLDIAKDRLYISSLDSPRRRSCQTVLKIAIENLAKAIAPVLSHMAEDIWQFIPYETGYKSVFQSGWVEMNPQWNKPELKEYWSFFRQLRDEVNKVLEAARSAKAIGSSEDAKVLLYASEEELRSKLLSFNSDNKIDELRYLFRVSQVEILDSNNAIESAEFNSTSEPVKIGVLKADGEKCERCWNYSIQVGTFEENPTICERCNDALIGKF